MRARATRSLALAAAIALGACSSAPETTDTPATPTPSVEPSVAPASASPSSPAAGFPIEAFADLGDEPVSDELAAELQMSTFVDGPDGYGLGLFNQADPYAEGFGHTGSHDGYLSLGGLPARERCGRGRVDQPGLRGHQRDGPPLVKALGSD